MRIIGLWGQECARKVASDRQTKGRLPLWAIDRPRPAAENANDICKGENLKPARTAPFYSGSSVIYEVVAKPS
jgi:hypothetical protein